MHHSTGYNWYSTNSFRRFNNQNVLQPSPQYYPEPGFERIHQFSDEGRVPLGNASDPEVLELQKRILDAVDDETLQEWECFRKDMREKSLLVRRQLGLPIEQVEEKYRTYPEKKHEFEAESDTSHYTPDRSKYVLNRKLNPLPSTSSAPSPRLTDDSDEVFIDDRVFTQSSPTPKTHTIIIGDGENSVRSSTQSHLRIDERIYSPQKSLKPLRKPATSSTGSTTSNSSSAVSAPECTLYKYGHCMSIETCGRTHDGVMTLDEKKAKIPLPAVIWQRKLPTIPICPGYVSMECWDSKCQLRHTVYPSDLI